MARQGKVSRASRAGKPIKRTAKKATARLRPAKRAAAAAPVKKKVRAQPKATARPAERSADIPIEVLNRAYTPKQTSLKTESNFPMGN